MVRDHQLKDKVILVTGATGDLGRELSIALAAEGSIVVACSRSRKALSALARRIRDSGGTLDYSVVDVTRERQVRSFVRRVLASRKRIDILINNAGFVNLPAPVEKTSSSDAKLNFETNVYSVFYLLKHVVPVMRKQDQGKIVNISSYSGKRGIPSLSAYSASKFAVVGLTQSVAKELEGTGVSCLAVCPGGVNSSTRRRLFGVEDSDRQQSPAFVASIVRDVLSGRIDVRNGEDIVVRYGKVVSINPLPK